MTEHSNYNTIQLSGLINLTLRWVVGWTYFSAFWRRLFLAEKLNPDSAGYIGEKFNHFLPNALGIKPTIEYLVTHPEALWWAMVIFTIIEGLVGLFIILGLFTRLMSLGLLLLALGILLGSGWIGTTCLDEWQIGVLGVSIGFVLILSGSGKYSLDYLILKRKIKISQHNWFSWVGSGDLNIEPRIFSKISLFGAMAITFLTLSTNQIFHGGIWGKLHNMSIKPEIELTNAKISDQELSFQIYRTQGVDVYGSFLYRIEVIDQNDMSIYSLEGDELAKVSPDKIHNKYITKVKPGKHSIIVPLGALAKISIDVPVILDSNLNYKLVLRDISGISWSSEINF